MADVGEEPKTLAEYIHRDSKKNELWKIACPNCEEYLNVYEWDCPCGINNKERSFITDGCEICETKFGEGDMDIQSRECLQCNHEIGFFDPYEFHNWSILYEGENSEDEFLKKFRMTDWTLVALIGLAAWTGFFIFFFILDRVFGKYTLGYSNIAAFIVGLFVILVILGTQLHYKKLLRNPKYRRSND